MNTTPKLPTETSEANAQPFDTSILAGTRSPSAIAQYTHYFHQYLTFAASFVVALEPSTLLRWRSYLVNIPYTTKQGPRQYSYNAINVRLSAIRSIMQEAAQQGYITQEVAQAFTTVAGIKPQALSERCNPHARVFLNAEQIRLICDAPDPGTLAGTMHRAFLSTLAGSGLRVSEAVNLTETQIEWGVDYEQRSGFVILLPGKGDAASDLRPLSLEAYIRIQIWLKVRPVSSRYIFTGFSGRGDRGPLSTPIRPVSAWEMVRRYARQVGIDHVKPHDFRRFVGAKLAEQDLYLAQKALGHKTVQTTQLYAPAELARGITDDLY